MTMNGIDISSWQAGINIAALNADFVIVKATQGTGYLSPDFKRQADQTLASGKLLGVYHFMSKENATAQADFFINAVKPYIGKAILVLDFEFGSVQEAIATGQGFAKQFLDRVKAQTGVAPLIYMSKAVTYGTDWSAVAGTYGLWVSQYATTNATGWQSSPWTDGKGYGAWSGPVIYQYTDNLQIAGYGGGLDGNIGYLDRNAWGKYANPSGQAVPVATQTPAPQSYNDKFRAGGNKFTAYKDFYVDEIKNINGGWQCMNYEMAGTRNPSNQDWTENGIPLDIIHYTRGVGSNSAIQKGSYVAFDGGWDYGTIDAYNDKDGYVGIDYPPFGRIWFKSDYWWNKI